MSDPIALAVAVHQRALLRQRRCAVCAELVPAALVLSGGTCPRCGDGVHGSEGLDAEAVVADLVPHAEGSPLPTCPDGPRPAGRWPQAQLGRLG